MSNIHFNQDFHCINIYHSYHMKFVEYSHNHFIIIVRLVTGTGSVSQLCIRILSGEMEC